MSVIFAVVAGVCGFIATFALTGNFVASIAVGVGVEFAIFALKATH